MTTWRRKETLQERIERVKREVNVSLDRAIGKEPVPLMYPLRCPELNLEGVEGMLVLRYWRLTPGCRLKSTAVNHTWKTINFADEVPEENNNKGLYGLMLSPSRTQASSILYMSNNQLSGIIEARGKIIVHKDGVVRAEWTRILNIMIPVRMLMPKEKRDYENYPRKSVWITQPPEVDEYVMQNLYEVYGIMPQVVDESAIAEMAFKATMYNIAAGHVGFRDERR